MRSFRELLIAAKDALESEHEIRGDADEAYFRPIRPLLEEIEEALSQTPVLTSIGASNSQSEIHIEALRHAAKLTAIVLATEPLTANERAIAKASGFLRQIAKAEPQP